VTLSPFLKLSPDVTGALAAGRPLVALESTIITHGMPYPQNLEMAGKVEAIIREAGAVPATVAIMDGAFRVGLTGADLERLAKTGMAAAKASRRDVAALLSSGGVAGTTVATTMQAANMAGIRVFATGGIGGVHRGEALDVSSDLATLARTPIAVVSAGAKSILDLARTLEVLETLGVLVLGYGTDEFPAFYTRESGLRLEHRCETPDAVARVLAARWALGQGGVLIANPIPAEAALPAAMIERAIETAVASAAQRGIGGKALTPFLLAELAAATAGASVRANRALALNNVRVGAALAQALRTL